MACDGRAQKLLRAVEGCLHKHSLDGSRAVAPIAFDHFKPSKKWRGWGGIKARRASVYCESRVLKNPNRTIAEDEDYAPGRVHVLAYQRPGQHGPSISQVHHRCYNDVPGEEGR